VDSVRFSGSEFEADPGAHETTAAIAGVAESRRREVVCMGLFRRGKLEIQYFMGAIRFSLSLPKMPLENVVAMR
jgi:hypothetical protein